YLASWPRRPLAKTRLLFEKVGHTEALLVASGYQPLASGAHPSATLAATEADLPFTAATMTAYQGLYQTGPQFVTFDVPQLWSIYASPPAVDSDRFDAISVKLQQSDGSPLPAVKELPEEKLPSLASHPANLPIYDSSARRLR